MIEKKTKWKIKFYTEIVMHKLKKYKVYHKN